MIVPGTRKPLADKEVPVDDEYIEAVNLNAEIMNCAKTAQENLYQMAMGFKKMRDEKLYKELGYDNFGDYCEGATGMSRMNVYNYITVVENLPENFVNSSLQNGIGFKKLQLLSKITENEREEITETVDLESTTVKELKVEIENLKNKQNILQDERDRALNSNAEASHQVFMADKKVLEMKDKVSELESQIKDLESRPIEVAVQSDSREIENLKDAMKRVDLDWAEKYRQLEDENLKDRRELMQKADKIKAEYEKKLAENPTKTDDKETFKAYLATALDGVKRLCGFVKSNANSDNYKFFREKSEQLADIIKNELEE